MLAPGHLHEDVRLTTHPSASRQFPQKQTQDLGKSEVPDQGIWGMPGCAWALSGPDFWCAGGVGVLAGWACCYCRLA